MRKTWWTQWSEWDDITSWLEGQPLFFWVDRSTNNQPLSFSSNVLLLQKDTLRDGCSTAQHTAYAVCIVYIVFTGLDWIPLRLLWLLTRVPAVLKTSTILPYNLMEMKWAWGTCSEANMLSNRHTYRADIFQLIFGTGANLKHSVC